MSDTILGGIATAIENATNGWKVEIGFNTDVGAWVAQQRSSGKTILISFDSDEPVGYSEGGRAKGYAMSLSVWMQSRADAESFVKNVWPAYKALREKLNGLQVTEDGKSYRVAIGAGNPSAAFGFAVATLQLRVQKG